MMVIFYGFNSNENLIITWSSWKSGFIFYSAGLNVGIDSRTQDTCFLITVKFKLYKKET
jgi:hypothetical protein